MKQLKDVIVRKRPLSFSSPASTPEQEEPVKDFSRIAAKRNAHRPRPMPGDPEVKDDTDPVDDPMTAEADLPRARQIWDIETSDEADFDSPSHDDPKPEVAEAPVRAKVDLSESKSPAQGDGSRVKTRILGLHTDALDNDVFTDKPENTAENSQFPAGWLVVTDGPGRGMSFAVSAGVSTIGRSKQQTICLDFGDASISRQNHASIAYDEEQNLFFIGHGGKSNIVRRNDNPVLSTEPLVDTDMIRIGKTTLRFVALCGADFTWRTTEPPENTDG